MITKSITGNTADWLGGAFNFTVTCGAAVMTPSIVLGPGVTSGSVLLSGLTAGAACSVVEAPTTPPGVGHTWSSTAYTPAATTTIIAASTVGITVTNTRT